MQSEHSTVDAWKRKGTDVRLRFAVRDWDYLTPLVLGDVASDRVELLIDRVETLTDAAGGDYDAAETSFSRYASAMAAGEDRFTGVPNFIMRGFRHRCIIVRQDSPMRVLVELRGARIGVTGWRDSGSTWTRAALRREGVGTEDALWFAGRLTAAHPITDRLGGFGRPGLIETMPDEEPMIDALARRALDAVFTPFMPAGYFGQGSPFRQLLPDFVAAERAYFDDVGYIPGMHLITVKADLAAAHPWLGAEISRMVDESRRIWTAKRRKYADTTPWMLDELLRCARDLPDDVEASGLAANRSMIADFGRELHVQGILDRALTPDELFPDAGVA